MKTQTFIDFDNIMIGNNAKFRPAPWTYWMESQPENIWYWMREGPWK